MNEKIEPVLSAEEWADFERRLYYASFDMDVMVEEAIQNGRDDRAIALLNRRLADSDERKITREKIAAVRRYLDMLAAMHPSPIEKNDIAEQARIFEGMPAVRRFLKALETYLPPEKT